MQSYIVSMNATIDFPAGRERNEMRNAIMAAMLALKPSDKLFPTTDKDIGSILANVCIVYTSTTFIPIDMIPTILSWCAHASEYTAHQARVLVSSLISSKRINVDELLDAALVQTTMSEDAFLGVLFGQAVGDAVGLPVEGHGRDVCKPYVQNVVKKQIVSPQHRHNFTFGQYSDDTQLTREMYLTLLQGRGNIDPTVYGLRIALLFQPGAYRVVGYGEQTARAAEAIRNGAHYTESGCAKGQGNGSVMRSSCLGALLAGKSKEVIVQVTQTMSAITHASPATLDGSAAIALAAHYAIATRHIPFTASHFIEYVASGVSPDFAKYVRELHKLTDNHTTMEDAARRIIEIGVSNKERQWGDGISVGARQTALWALWCFIKNPDSYVDCIADAIIVGGDVDTTAATVGGIIGGRVGASKIPAIWLKPLHDYGEWNYEQLLDMGKKAFKYVQDDKVTVSV